MKKGSTMRGMLRRTAGALALACALTIGLSADTFSFVSLAESAGKITAASAKVRKEPDTSSETVASTTKNAKVGVIGQTTGSDGYTWYQVNVEAGEVGYIRSDLMKITDGTTPPAVEKASATTASNTVATSATTTSAAANAVAVSTSTAVPVTATTTGSTTAVNPVQPVSANITGQTQVNVRKDASTTSDIVAKASGGLAITVNGTAKGSDGKDWYQVVFLSNGSEVNGFIRSDYVKLNGELVSPGAAEQQTEETENAEAAEGQDTQSQASKDWDTYYSDNAWHLLNNQTGEAYNIADIFSTVEANNNTLKEVIATNQTQKIIVIAMVILAVILVSVISVLIFKLREMRDDADFEAAEREEARRRSSQGARRPANAEGRQRPVNGEGRQRPANGEGRQRPANGEGRQRPANGEGRQRPANGESRQHPASGEGRQRPANGESRQRPANGESRQRPANGEGRQRPVSSEGRQRPANGEHRQRSEAAHPIQSRPVEEEYDRMPAGEAEESVLTDQTIEYAPEYAKEILERTAESQAPKKEKRQSRNFANDDEFEFHYLDWDDELE